MNLILMNQLKVNAMNLNLNEKYNSNRNKFFQPPQGLNTIHEYSAGILPYQIENNKVYICLGQDRDGNWSDFGGKCEKKDRYNVKETAAREFFEESYGAFLTLEATLKHLSNETNFKVVNSESMSGIRYYMFLLQLPKSPHVIDRFHRVKDYVNYIFKDRDKYQYQEKVDIKWISLDTLISILDSTDKKKSWPLRKVFLRTLDRHRNVLQSLYHKEELYL